MPSSSLFMFIISPGSSDNVHLIGSYRPGFGSNQTEPLSRGLTIYSFQKKN